LELRGDRGSSPPQAVRAALLRVREVCPSGLELVSDQQPEKLRVDNRRQGGPAIWLHGDLPDTAWIMVNIGPVDWSKLAYQFGHELGHVLCNSWGPSAKPGPSTQWLEKALVEAFTVRGLGLLATSWEENPPFAGDHAFAATIREHRANRLKMYNKDQDQESATWFRSHRSELESGRPADKDFAVLKILPILEIEPACVEDLGGSESLAGAQPGPDRGVSQKLGDKLR
jgi:hypothetical protein